MDGASEPSPPSSTAEPAGGSVVLRVSGTRKAATTFAALRRAGRLQLGGLNDTLLVPEYDRADDPAASYLRQYAEREGLGTFLGVFVPCTCTIFGFVVFMRLGFVVGYAGVWLSLLIVGACFGLCLLRSCCARSSATRATRARRRRSTPASTARCGAASARSSARRSASPFTSPLSSTPPSM